MIDRCFQWEYDLESTPVLVERVELILLLQSDERLLISSNGF